MRQQRSRGTTVRWIVQGTPAAYEAALGRAHRAVYQAQQEAAALVWQGEEFDLGCILQELTELGSEALSRKRRRLVPTDEGGSAA